MAPPARSVVPTRFVGLDLHRSYVVVGAIDAQQTVVLSPRRVPLQAFLTCASTHLTVRDAVVVEATANAWIIYDHLVPVVASVTVANAWATKLLSAVPVKTDARDPFALARLVAADLVPAVWVPPADVHELRALVAHRKRLGSNAPRHATASIASSTATMWSRRRARSLAPSSARGGTRLN